MENAAGKKLQQTVQWTPSLEFELVSAMVSYKKTERLSGQIKRPRKVRGRWIRMYEKRQQKIRMEEKKEKNTRKRRRTGKRRTAARFSERWWGVFRRRFS